MSLPIKHSPVNNNSQEAIVSALLKEIGIEINGNKPEDIQVHNPAFYRKVMATGSLGAGESYMDGDWSCASLDRLVATLATAKLNRKAKANVALAWHLLQAKLFNLGNKAQSLKGVQRHYDIGNDLYSAMLDKRMVYTCAYWKDAQDLDSAQEAKLDLVCRKVGLKPGMKVLDIGGGWGSFAKYAAQNYGVEVLNVSLSKEQIALANKLCAGLKVENRLQDYRDVKGEFDAIVSIGMFEHVNHKQYRTYMKTAERNLKDGGLFLLHTIGNNVSTYTTEPWIHKYVFPNTMIPSLKQIAGAVERLFVIEDIHNFGPYYDKTLMAWNEKFQAAWPELKEKYGERFHRMWELYLLSCAGLFRARNLQLWQIVLSKKGVPGGYASIR